MQNFPFKFISAVIALQPLPGAPLFEGDAKKIVQKALDDLKVFLDCEVDSVLFANDYDRPFVATHLPEKDYAVFKEILTAARRIFTNPIGINVKLESWQDELKLAYECKLDYMRVGNFALPYLGSEGILKACAGQLLRARKQLNAGKVRIFADVKKKHVSHEITKDISFEVRVKECETCLADAVVVTSRESGVKPNENDIVKARSATKLPIIVGSGTNAENIEVLYNLADGFIVGSTFRKEGNFYADVDPQRVKNFMSKVRNLRRSN